MSRTPVTVGNPRYGDAKGVSILLDVTFAELPNHGVLQFYARADDSEPHGAELHQRASAGEFGAIAAFAPVAPLK